MLLPGPLTPARLVRRYKRFLADVEFADVELDAAPEPITAHVANPGSMMGLGQPGAKVWLSKSDDPKRKLAYSWQLQSLNAPEEPPLWCVVNTALSNRIVEEALAARRVPELAAYGRVRREVRYGRASRVDFLLEEDGLPPAYVEVKHVHLRRDGDLAEFPDARTARGAKHLQELAQEARGGARAVMLYLLMRDDVARFALAADIDPAYAAMAREARAAGVEMLAYGCRFTPTAARADGAIHMSVEVDHRVAMSELTLG